MVRVKICGFTNVSDAKEAIELGVDALGLVFFAASPRHVTVQTAKQIAAIVPPFTQTVGLFVNATEQEVREVLRQVPLDVLQFHGDESPEFCRLFARPYIKAVRVNEAADIELASKRFYDARALLFDAHVEGVYGGTGKAFDWQMLPQDLKQAWVLSGGLHPDNVTEAIRKTGAVAVDVSSGVEAAKGIKDAQKMRQFIQGVKRAGTEFTE